MSVALTPWVCGRSELFTELPADVHRIDPRRQSSAAFVAELRELDRIGWAEPLGRVRPSWVFYDCALIPGVLSGYAVAGSDGQLRPVSMLATIPTIAAEDLVQSLAVAELADMDNEALAVETLAEGLAHIGAARVVAAIPWGTPFMARFLALGPLSIRTAWTPAHDEPRTLTFALTLGEPPGLMELGPLKPTDEALVQLQADIERGAERFVWAVRADRIMLAGRA